MRRILTLALAGVLTLAGCSDDEKKSSPTNAAPVLTVGSLGDVTESLVALAAIATDADAADVITCAFAFVSQPAGSRVTLDADGGDCRAAALFASFTPLVEGAYVVRVSVSDGVQATTTTQDVTVTVASKYGGGTVSGTTATPTAAMTALITALATVPSPVSVTAQNAFKAFANIALTGTPPVQGAPLDWASRPYDVVDVREPADFAAGHIPGAVNVPIDELPRVLLGDPRFPGTETDMRKVLVAGYSQGDTLLAGSILSAGRFSLGAIPTSPDERIYYLAHGMATWTFDKAVAPMRWDDDLGTRRFQWKPTDGLGYLEASATAYDKGTQPRYELPNVTDFNAATTAPMKQILVRVREWAAWARAEAEANGVPGSEAFVTNWGRWKALRDAASTPQILTSQNNTQWQAAHAVGAIPILAADVLNTAELTLYRPSEPIFVHCFTNTGAVANCFKLSVLGYQSRTVLYGVTGALDPTLTAAGYNTGFVAGVEDKGSGGNDFPLASEANPGTPDSLAWATPSRAGCVECHRDYAAHFTEVTTTSTTAPAEEVLSEGEG